MMNKVTLNRYDNSGYDPGSTLKRTLWYFANLLFFKPCCRFHPR
jgi:hypothetical protein